MIRRRSNTPSIAAMPRGERVMSWAQVTALGNDPIHLVASAEALYIPTVHDLGSSGDAIRLPWASIDRAHWEQPILTVVAQVDEVVRTWRIDLVEPRSLPEFVRERVMATIVVSEHIALVDELGVRLIARRSSIDSDLEWTMSFDAGLDSADPNLRALAEQALVDLRAVFGV